MTERLRIPLLWVFFAACIFSAFLLLLTVAGCSTEKINSPMMQEPPLEDLSVLEGKPGSGEVNNSRYPIIKSKTFHYDEAQGYYSGGTITMGQGNGSHFHVFENSLIPPPFTVRGRDVTIEMRVDYDESLQELVFTFGPSRTQFMPRARIKLDYKLLNVEKADLFYIDAQGNYISQTPDYVNPKKKFMYLYVEHFSRYAVAISR